VTGAGGKSEMDCIEVDKEKHGVDFRDKVKYNERNDQLFVMRTTYVNEQE